MFWEKISESNAPAATILTAFPLIIDFSVAIISTQVPILLKQGLWPAETEARTDYCMRMGPLFLLIVGAGLLSIDARHASGQRRANS